MCRLAALKGSDKGCQLHLSLLLAFALACRRRWCRLAAGCRSSACGNVCSRALLHEAFVLGQQPLQQWECRGTALEVRPQG